MAVGIDSGTGKPTISSNVEGEWTACVAAAKGLGHSEAGTQCQDSVASIVAGNVNVVCLADGAGSCSQSQHGAQAMVLTIGALLAERFDTVFAEAEHGGTTVVREAISKCLATTSEMLGCNERDLSSTLLGIAISGERCIAIHVGDGVIGAVVRGSPTALSLPQNGDFANITVFTTSPGLSENLRARTIALEGISGFILMSDGAARSLHRQGTRQLAPAVTKLVRYCSEGHEDVDEQIRYVVDHQLTARTLDDCSIAILAKKATS